MKRRTIQILLVLMCALIALSVTACDGTGDGENTTASANGDVGTTVALTEGAEDPTFAETSTGGMVEESEAASADYFDNVAFVGDSVSLKLSYYAAATGSLGKAQFFTAGSLGCANALWEVSEESVHPSYQGKKMLVEDCVAASKADKVYIMLGMNDIGLYGIDDTVKNYETLINAIVEKSPNVQIVVQSMTPMTSTSTILGDSLNNENIKIYNSRLLDMCKEKGWAYVDVASVMYDAEGKNLNRDFCSDPDGLGVHFSETGCDKWVAYLTTHTP